MSSVCIMDEVSQSKATNHMIYYTDQIAHKITKYWVFPIENNNINNQKNIC